MSPIGKSRSAIREGGRARVRPRQRRSGSAAKRKFSPAVRIGGRNTCVCAALCLNFGQLTKGEAEMGLAIAPSQVHGDGCFSTRCADPGELIAECPILILSPDEMEIVRRTSMKDYVFYLRDDEAGSQVPWCALAIGPISFINHDSDPTCDFALDEARGTIRLFARRPIRAREELTIDYGDYADEII
ncbi:SET domain-containing protein [Propylenella binzhouense]